MKTINILIVTALLLFSVNGHAGQDRLLPEGIMKKSSKGKPLPPGWKKKLKKGSKLDKSVYDQGRVVVPLDKKGYISIRVEDKVIRLLKATREIVEVTGH